MLRQFLFGNNQEVKKNEEPTKIDDDQPLNKFNDVYMSSGPMEFAESLLNIGASKVLSTGPDKKGILWNFDTGEVLYELIGHSRVITATFYLECFLDEESSETLPVIVTASSDETIRIWELSDGHCRKVVKQHEGTIKCFCLISSESSKIVSGGQDICLWNLSFELLFKLERNSLDYVHSIIAITLSRIVGATDQPNLIIYDICEELSLTSSSSCELYEVKESKKLLCHRKSISSLKYVSESMFVSASMDGAILIWNSYNLKVIRKFNNYEYYENINDHTFPYNVKDLLIADQRYAIAAIGTGFAVYDVHHDKCICRIVNAHHSEISCILLLNGGYYLATSSLDGTIRLWASSSQCDKDYIQHNNQECSLVNLFGKSIFDVKSFPLEIELVGICNAHSNSVKCIIECKPNGFMSCGSDGMFIFWKDSLATDKCQTKELYDTLNNIDWLSH